jgi:hypothetical protein
VGDGNQEIGVEKIAVGNPAKLEDLEDGDAVTDPEHFCIVSKKMKI